MRDGTPDRFVPDFCKFAQSRGECPGDSSTFPRAFGVLTADDADSCGASPALGDRFGIGPRFGRGPLLTGARKDVDEVGRARRFDAFSDGGGMSEDAPGLEGGAMGPGAGGGAIILGWADALCAEFRAGKEGGGRLSSSSSSSSEFWCSANVKVGMDSTVGARGTDGIAFGVVCGEGSLLSGEGDGGAGRIISSEMSGSGSVALAVAAGSSSFPRPVDSLAESHALHVDGG